MSLAEIVRRAWVHARAKPHHAQGSPLQAAAFSLASQEYGLEALLRNSGLINCAAAAILCHDRFEVTEMSPGAASLVDDTDLCTVPSVAPALLARPLLLEAAKGARAPLWPRGPVSVFCYPYRALDGREGYYLAKLTTADRFVGGFWYPRWSGEPIEASVPAELYDVSLAEAFAKGSRAGFATADEQHCREVAKIAQYVLTLAILWEARNTPLRVTEDREAERASARSRRPPPPVQCASVRRVTLRPLDAPEGSRTLRTQAPTRDDAETERANHKTITVSTTVRNHVQRYHCGPNRERIEWRFKARASALRWASERVTTRVGVERPAR